MLPSGTFRAGASLGAAGVEPEPGDERLRRALRIACAAEFGRKLDPGLDTMLKERSDGLPVGRMQRIPIARFPEDGTVVEDAKQLNCTSSDRQRDTDE